MSRPAFAIACRFHVARPRGVDGKHRQQRLHGRPDPVADALARVVRLVHPQGIGAAHRGRRFGRRRLQRASDLAMRLRDGADAEAQPHQLIEQVADLALRQVVARAQHADQGQRTRPQLDLGRASRQHPRMRPAAARAAAAVEPVLIDLRAHRRDFEDLVVLRLICQLDLAAAPTHRRRLAVHQPIYLALVEHRAAVPLVPGLRAALTLAAPALRPIHAARSVGRRRLGRVVGVQANALFEQLHPLQQLCDDRMAPPRSAAAAPPPVLATLPAWL